MTSQEAAGDDVTVAELSAQFAQFRRSAEAQIASLTQEVARLGGGGAPSGGPRVVATERGGEVIDVGGAIEDRPVSRRGALLAMGGVAAGGLGVALGSTVLAAQPAAADGTPVELGGNNVTTATTVIATSAARYALQVTTSESLGAALAGEDLSNNTDGWGVYGYSDSGIGLVGATGAAAAVPAGPIGVVGISEAGTGVSGIDESSGIGVKGTSENGYGVTASGGHAPLFLSPSGITGPPSGQLGAIVSDPHQIGEILVDVSGAVFVCTGAGQQGIWREVSLAAPGYYNERGLAGELGVSGSVNLLASPIRVFDSRTTGSANPANSTRPSGPAELGSPITLTIAPVTVGSTMVPAGAVGVIGNVTVTEVGGGGWVTLYPDGATTPTTSTPSTLNFQASDFALANACTVALSTAGKFDILAFQSNTHVIFDVTGFLF
jgi:hypothetical protein